MAAVAQYSSSFLHFFIQIMCVITYYIIGIFLIIWCCNTDTLSNRPETDHRTWRNFRGRRESRSRIASSYLHQSTKNKSHRGVHWGPSYPLPRAVPGCPSQLARCRHFWRWCYHHWIHSSPPFKHPQIGCYHNFGSFVGQIVRFRPFIFWSPFNYYRPIKPFGSYATHKLGLFNELLYLKYICVYF